MKRHPNLLWLVVLLLGWLFDFLFWKQSPGINFAVFAALCLAGGFLLMRIDRKRIALGAVPLMPLILYFAAMTFIRLEPLTVALSVTFTLFLMAMLAITFIDGDWLSYTLIRHLTSLLKLAGSVLIRPLFFSTEIRRDQLAAGTPVRRVNAWPVVRGVLIAIPVLLIFGALLASADVVFGSRLEQLIRLLRLENLPQYVFRLVYILVAAYASAGVFLHASGYGRSAAPATADSGSPFSFLGFVEAAIVLGSLAILFAAFVLVQFQYFFGGQVNIGVEGYTYSDYARRGFGELLFVAFFSLLLILGLSSITRRENEMQRKLFSALGVAIVALVTIMLVSAYQRLALYEAAYGFSRLRTYTNVLLIWIGVLLVAVVVLEILRRERAFAAAALIAALGFGITLSLLNVDVFIVDRNVDRAMRGEALDAAYLASLSDDSVPAIAQIYQTQSYPLSLREAMGAVLACRLGLYTQRSSGDWRSFDLSSAQAARAIAAVQPNLAGYKYVGGDFPSHVAAPGGTGVYDCQGSGSY
jgi:hypothetical protein